MSENLRDDFFVLADNMRYGMQAIYELADYIESLKETGSEKKRCTTAIRDNIEIMRRQIDEISDIYGRVRCYGKEENSIRNVAGFKMKETRALVADDGEGMNQTVSEMLRQFNIEVDIAKNKEEAVKLFEQRKYDLILISCAMSSGIDGGETVRQIRNMGERGKNQLIIGLAAKIEGGIKKVLNKYNVELILFKPVKYHQIAVILRNELPDKIIPV